MRHARDADDGLSHEFTFYIRQLTGMIPGGDLTDPDAATVPKWHIIRYLPKKKEIIAADPIWNVPFHVCANSGVRLLTEMRLPQRGSLNAIDTSGRIAEQGVDGGGAATVRVRAGMNEGKKWWR